MSIKDLIASITLLGLLAAAIYITRSSTTNSPSGQSTVERMSTGAGY